MRLVVLIVIAVGGFQMQGIAQEPLGQDELRYLKKIEEATFSGFEKLLDPATGLPVDIASVAAGDVSILPNNADYNKTSPTNIGLGFLYLILARDRGYLSQENAYQHALHMMDTLERLETYEGFLYNWYYLSNQDKKIPEVTLNRFISSLDSGNLDISLMAAGGAFQRTELSSRIDRFIANHDYYFFFNKNPNQRSSEMINVGYDEAQKIYHGADYSIFNTEARMTALVAILKNNVPESAWKKQARLLRFYTTIKNEKIPVVAAWGGSLYETLFADEIVGGYKIAPDAFQKNALQMIRIHQDKGRRISRTGIWGFSNGEVPGKNRYEMAGISEIAYNRFPGEFVTAYSSFLALRYAPQAVINNLKRMEILNPKVFNSNYGFTDSIDPKSAVINKNILSLDKGMEVLSIGNFMNSLEGKNEISDYFWKYAEEKGWEEKGQALLRGEENHPSFRALFGLLDTDVSSNGFHLPSVDLIEVRQDMGAFYEPSRANASVKLSDLEGKDHIIEIQYDVSQRYAYSGIFIHYDDLDVSKYRMLTFEVKGDEMQGYPETIKAELKYRSEYVQFDHIPLTPVWNAKRILVPKDSKIDELAFVIENATARNRPKGKIFIRSLALQ
ncbi:MAG: hypothetical protein HY584_03540 [Candidatus Omnitrophica bacterium]|nr:hypothetical protein [Candidatus Omnitrophota bacterium]